MESKGQVVKCRLHIVECSLNLACERMRGRGLRCHFKRVRNAGPGPMRIGAIQISVRLGEQCIKLAARGLVEFVRFRSYRRARLSARPPSPQQGEQGHYFSDRGPAYSMASRASLHSPEYSQSPYSEK